MTHWKSYATAASNQYKPQLLATTQQLDWWKIMEDVEMDVIIAKENIQLWPGAPLLRSLETEFQPKWEELKDTLTKNKIEEFAIDIEKLGIEYRYFQLTQWGKKLAAQAGRGPTSMPCRKLWRGFRIRSRNLKTKGMPNTSAV